MSPAMPERLPSASLRTSAVRAAAGIRAGSLGVVEAGGPCEVDTDAQTGGRSAGSVLAFDFGVKRIGVALGTQFAVGRPATSRALTTIDEEHNDARFAAVAALIAEWQPLRLLVGRPSNEDGTPHEMTRRCERFARQLHGRFRLPVETVDERFSSTEADAVLRGHGLSWRRRRTQVDAVAALVILQSWFAADVRTNATA
jgi:putative Holliday junction resolvase